MWQFLQTYGIWIFFGILFILMMRMHGHGGCSMGMSHDQHNEHIRQKASLPEMTQVDSSRTVPLEQLIPPEQEYLSPYRTVPLEELYPSTQRNAPLEGEHSDVQHKVVASGGRQ
jgi:hypothetical protein